MRFLGPLLRGLGDLVFPPSCVHCGGLVEEGAFRHLCARCARQLPFVRPPHCPICGHPLRGGEIGALRCAHCAEAEPDFGAGRAAVLLRGPARSLLIELKYRGGRHVLADVEEVFRRSPPVLEHARGCVLVPVPLHPRKERERGFNQSVLLAGALSRAAGGGLPTAKLLLRIADTPTQTALTRRDRERNLKNAFALHPRAGINPGLRYLLVDDVLTTGATLNGCARALRRAGCRNVDAAAFGRG